MSGFLLETFLNCHPDFCDGTEVVVEGIGDSSRLIPNQKTEKRREKKENKEEEKKLVDCKEASKHLLQGRERREVEETLSSGMFLITMNY